MARRQLVIQHLENISRQALEKYEKIIREFVRRRQGIYALYRGEKLYYVGLASNLRSRLTMHLRDRHAKTWDRFSVYMTTGDDHLKELESLAIRIAHPKGNRTKGKFARSENVKSAFKKQMRLFQRAELSSIFDGDRRAIDQDKTALIPGPYGALAKYAARHGAFRIRFTYKGRYYKARVLENGWIRYKGRLYRTPSAAAVAVRHKSTDGWYAWRYEQGRGNWVFIDALRKR